MVPVPSTNQAGEWLRAGTDRLVLAEAWGMEPTRGRELEGLDWFEIDGKVVLIAGRRSRDEPRWHGRCGLETTCGPATERSWKLSSRASRAAARHGRRPALTIRSAVAARWLACSVVPGTGKPYSWLPETAPPGPRSSRGLARDFALRVRWLPAGWFDEEGEPWMTTLLTRVALALSLLANVYLAVLLLSAGVSVDHAQSSSVHLWNRRAEALQILNREWAGRPLDEVLALATEMEEAGMMVKRHEETIEIGDFDFEIAEGVVKAVRDVDSLASEAPR